MALGGLNAFDWGLVALVVFPLLQLPLVLYLSRYVELGEEDSLDHAVEFRDSDPDPDRNPRDTPNESPQLRTVDPRSRSSAPSRIACSACGVENDPAFTFCRSCVARLSGSRPVADPTPPY